MIKIVILHFNVEMTIKL